MTTPANHPTLQCPRCGYDVRGITLTWQESCPLEGTCSECGLTLYWPDIFQEESLGPRWFIESALSLPKTLRRSVKTFAYSFMPWRFWSDVRMEHRVRTRALIVYLLLLLGCMYVIYASYGAAEMWRRVEYRGGTRIEQLTMAGLTAVAPWWNGRTAWTWGGRPLTPRHLHSQNLEALGEWVEDGCAELLICNEPAPRYLLISFLSMMAFPLCPLCSVTLAVTFKRAKVKLSHLVRITAYSCLILPVGIVPVCEMLRLATPWSWYGGEASLVAEAACAFMPVWLVCWWALAMGRYLKIRHAWASGLAIVLLAYLVAAGVTALLLADLGIVSFA
ncbi:MAG: hypothetical protein D8M59_11755 [Planctomycetes bacterium]|nr:hypothetical protein [Planctomycetota bacterium]NOG55434.1 hypothetical protein [Planctomycetota bacterium]